MSTLPPILEVEWTDASRTVGWTSRKAALNIQPVRAHTVGFLLDRSPDRWLLASALADGGETVGTVEQIPATLVVSASCLANCENLQASTPEETRTPGDRLTSGPGLRVEAPGDVPGASPPQGPI